MIGIDDIGDDRDLEWQVLCPSHPVPLVLPPRVALVFQVPEQPAQFGGELRFDHHLVAAHVHDVIHMLDVDRALLHTRPARGAVPEHLGVDDPADFPALVVDLRRPDQRPLRLQQPDRVQMRERRPVRLGHAFSSPVARSIPPPALMYGAFANEWSRSASITSFGDNGFAVFHAGHCD